MRSGRSLQ